MGCGGVGWAVAEWDGWEARPGEFFHQPKWQTKPGFHCSHCECGRSCNPAIAQFVMPLTVDGPWFDSGWPDTLRSRVAVCAKKFCAPRIRCLLRNEQLNSFQSPHAGGRHVLLSGHLPPSPRRSGLQMLVTCVSQPSSAPWSHHTTSQHMISRGLCQFRVTRVVNLVVSASSRSAEGATTQRAQGTRE